MPSLAFSISLKAAFSSNHYLPVRKPFPIVSQSTITIPGDNVSSIAHWGPSHSNALYKIDAWGAPYFAVNSSGNIIVRPHGARTKGHEEIDLLEVVKKASDTKCVGGLDLQLPLIIKSPDILKDRLEYLHSSFNTAIKSQGYNSHYQGVYPVKCNPDRFLVEDIVKFGSSFRFGLEVGSKPELLLSMGCLCNGSPESLLICNGFKDIEYISLALIARKLSLNTVIVLEQEEELDSIIDISMKLKIRPVLGVRAKLRTKHSGHFGSTSGTEGKFGLTTTQILRVVKRLEQNGMLDCFQLLHFHMGSQIPSIAVLNSGVCEAMQIYCELVRLGASMKVIDIGGGLGIDYDGSQSANSEVSIGYTVEQYAMAVVQTVKFVCDRNFVKHPIICSESGRALVSHHSILIFEAFCSSKHAIPTMSSFYFKRLIEQLPKEVHLDYNNLSESIVRGDYEAVLVYANQLKDTCVEMFKEGSLDMEQLAATDGLCDLVAKKMGVSNHISTYHVNFSVFTSFPDFWAIQQLFPIIPIHRLDEYPTRRAILSDLTCDSDGKIDKFIGGEASLPLHELQGENGMKYYLGMFLGGAYQEALGGVHNLFGAPSVIHVSKSDGPSRFAITRAMPGSSCSDVLCSMQHEPEIMFQTLKHRIKEYVHDNGHMSRAMIENVISKSFHNMPYLTRRCKWQ